MIGAAEGGTLFIEEIAGLKLATLEKVLTYASQETLLLLRGKRTDGQKMRIVAAMDHDSVADAKAKILIGDLACRLNAMTLYVSALRERLEDILPLAKHLLSVAKAERRNSRLYLSPEAATLINSYSWPGNIPELRDVIASAASRTPDHCVTPEYLPKKLLGNLSSVTAGSRPGATLEELEREHIIRILCQSSTVSAAAKTLGINVVTLWRKRKRYKLEQFWPQTAGASRARA
jgi:NtrC-family two-component system response regulator AlgB